MFVDAVAFERLEHTIRTKVSSILRRNEGRRCQRTADGQCNLRLGAELGLSNTRDGVDRTLGHTLKPLYTLPPIRLQVLRGKEEVARAEVETTLCKEVADPRGHLPAQAMSTLAACERPTSKNYGWHGGLTTWWKRSHEGLRGASRFTFVSHLFAKFHRTLWVGFCLFGGFCCVFVCVVYFFWDGLVKILHSSSTSSFHVSSS